MARVVRLWYGYGTAMVWLWYGYGTPMARQPGCKSTVLFDNAHVRFAGLRSVGRGGKSFEFLG